MTCTGYRTLDASTWRATLDLLRAVFADGPMPDGLLSHAEMIGDDLEGWGFLDAADERPLVAHRLASDIVGAIASDIYNVADDPEGNPGMRAALYAAAGAWLAAMTTKLDAAAAASQEVTRAEG